MLNYTIAVVFFVIPAIVAGVRGMIPWSASVVVAGASCLLAPVLLYRSTWSWWLMLYFYFLPQRLPANGGPVGSEEED